MKSNMTDSSQRYLSFRSLFELPPLAEETWRGYLCAFVSLDEITFTPFTTTVFKTRK